MNNHRFLCSSSSRSRVVRGVVALLTGLVPGVVPSTHAAQAHVHGHATLEVGLEADQVLLALRGPAQVFLGFEHVPETPDELAALSRARAVLESPERLFSMIGADCKLAEMTLHLPFTVGGQPPQVEQRHDESQADGHLHHDDDHEQHHGEHSSHVDVSADYLLSCDQRLPDALEAIIFNEFSWLEEIDAAWISERGSGSSELTPRDTRLLLHP